MDNYHPNKISIIIPCYNVSDKLRRCLDSVINQNIENVDMEIICIDDCSKDNTLEILYEYERQYPDIFIIIPLSENVKQGKARNIGLQYASGEYITYIDSDDEVSLDYLDYLYKNIVDSDFEVVECSFDMIYLDGQTTHFVGNNEVCIDMNNLKDKKWYVLNRGPKTGPCARMYKKSFLTDNNIVFAEGIYMEDILFSELVMIYMNHYKLLPESKYYYYVNPNGTMSGRKNHLLDEIIAHKMGMEAILKSGKFAECTEELEYLHYTKAFYNIITYMLYDNTCYDYDIIQKLRQDALNIFPNIGNNRYIENYSAEDNKTTAAILKYNLSKEDLDYIILGK